MSLPTQENSRKITDVCCLIVGITFWLVLFVLAFIMLNRANLVQINFPSDSHGNVCMLTPKKTKLYPFLYFQDIQNPNSQRYPFSLQLSYRFCVEECPQQGVRTNCLTECELGFYNNTPVSNRLGAYCLPTDQSAREQLYTNSGLYKKWNSLMTIDLLLVGLGLSVLLSLLWMTLTLCCPRVVIWLSIFLSLVLLSITIILLFTSNNKSL